MASHVDALSDLRDLLATFVATTPGDNREHRFAVEKLYMVHNLVAPKADGDGTYELTPLGELVAQALGVLPEQTSTSDRITSIFDAVEAYAKRAFGDACRDHHEADAAWAKGYEAAAQELRAKVESALEGPDD